MELLAMAFFCALFYALDGIYEDFVYSFHKRKDRKHLKRELRNKLLVEKIRFNYETELDKMKPENKKETKRDREVRSAISD